MANDWLRLWHDMPTNPKWRVISRKSKQPISTVIAVWNFVLVDASTNATERGRTHSFESEDVAAALDVLQEDVESIMEAFQGKLMEGDRLKGWSKRQPKREDNSALRAKQWRERQKEKTQPNADERKRTQDKDTDKIIKKDTTYPKKGTRIPENWEPEDRIIRLCRQVGATDLFLEGELVKFRNYWESATGTKATKLDWGKTFHNWILTAIERQTKAPESTEERIARLVRN